MCVCVGWGGESGSFVFFVCCCFVLLCKFISVVHVSLFSCFVIIICLHFLKSLRNLSFHVTIFGR